MGGDLELMVAQRIFLDRLRTRVSSLRNYASIARRDLSSESKEINNVTAQVEFTDLAAGDYQVTVDGKPIQLGNGGFRTAPLGAYYIKLPEGEAMEGDL